MNIIEKIKITLEKSGHKLDTEKTTDLQIFLAETGFVNLDFIKYTIVQLNDSLITFQAIDNYDTITDSYNEERSKHIINFLNLFNLSAFNYGNYQFYKAYGKGCISLNYFVNDDNEITVIQNFIKFKHIASDIWSAFRFLNFDPQYIPTAHFIFLKLTKNKEKEL